MADDKRSPNRVGKPLVYGEIIISEPIFVQYLAAAREEGRAAGYAEAIEKAAKLCDDRSKAHQENVDRYEQLRDWESMGHQNAAAIASNSLRNAIRKLAPADKEKP